MRAGVYLDGGGGERLPDAFFPVCGPTVAVFQGANNAVLGCFLPVDAAMFGPCGHAFVAGVGEGIAGLLMGAKLCKMGLGVEAFENGSGFAGAEDEGLAETGELLVELVERFLNELPVERVEVGGVDDLGFYDEERQ